MTDKSRVKDFLAALAKDDYVTVNEIFPEVVNSSLKSIINKRKPDVIDKLNTKASDLVSTSFHDKSDEEGEKEDEVQNKDEE